MVRIFNVTSADNIANGFSMTEFRTAIGNKPVVAAFYMDGCDHCKNLTEPWTDFENAVETKYPDDNTVVAFVHKDVAPMIADNVDGKLQIQGYPTIMGFSGSGKPTEFSGARDVTDLMEFYERIVHGNDKKGGGRKGGGRKGGGSKKVSKKVRKGTRKKGGRGKNAIGGVKGTTRKRSSDSGSPGVKKAATKRGSDETSLSAFRLGALNAALPDNIALGDMSTVESGSLVEAAKRRRIAPSTPPSTPLTPSTPPRRNGGPVDDIVSPLKSPKVDLARKTNEYTHQIVQPRLGRR